ncbi:MAG: copper homeostasis periplasmic binding protein CopC [Pseudomonadota bacterium]|nr:copper homeostasis periplasmic binding protein CopC [Pseudomonadota bacterium]
MNMNKIVAVLTLAAAAGAASVAQAHAKIESSEPTADSVMEGAPKAIRLHFNEALEPAFSKIELFDAKQAAVVLPKVAVDKEDPKTMSTTVPVLESGKYSVRWTTMTHDGHKAKGQYSFTVK